MLMYVRSYLAGGPGCMLMYMQSYLAVQGGDPGYMLMYVHSYLVVQGAWSCTCHLTWWPRVHDHVHVILPGGPGCMLMYMPSYLAKVHAQGGGPGYMRSYLVVQGACSCTSDHTWWSRVHAHVHAIIPGRPGCMLLYMRSYLAKVHAHVHAIIPGGPGPYSCTCDHTWWSRVHAHTYKGRWHCKFIHDSLWNCKGLQIFVLWDLELETDLVILGSKKQQQHLQ